MANRDEVQASKDRKPIDYHLFLCDKWKTNSILHYQDDMERKFTTNNKHSIIEQVNEEENRVKSSNFSVIRLNLSRNYINVY